MLRVCRAAISGWHTRGHSGSCVPPAAPGKQGPPATASSQAKPRAQHGWMPERGPPVLP